MAVQSGAAALCMGALLALSAVVGHITTADAESQGHIQGQRVALLADFDPTCLTGGRQSRNASSMTRIADADAPPSTAADPVGIQLVSPSGACLAGSCSSHKAVPLGGSALTAIPCSTTRTFANGDKYTIQGVATLSENSSGTSLPGTLYLIVTFAGGKTGGDSVGAPDTLTLDYYLDFTSNGNANNLGASAIGSFSSGIAAKSTVTVSALYCQGTGSQTKSNTLGPISAPSSSFNQSTTTFVPACPSQTLVNTTYTLTFQKGSKPGSYIKVGNTTGF